MPQPLKMWAYLPLVAYLLYTLYHKWSAGICKSRQSMDGKVVLITGANAGVGFEMAKDLAGRGARVILACRDMDKGVDAQQRIIAATGNRNICVRQVDFTSFRSVRNFTYDILNNEVRLDILINNASMGPSCNDSLTEDGLPREVQVNYFSPFLLTMQLVEFMKYSTPARIINVSSQLHRYGLVNPATFHRARRGYGDRCRMFADTKLATLLFTMRLSRFLEGSGVTANSMDPGLVNTEFFRQHHYLVRLAMRMLMMRTAWEGAQTGIHLAVAPELVGVSGRYYANCRAERPADAALDTEIADRLWRFSERRVGFRDYEDRNNV